MSSATIGAAKEISRGAHIRISIDLSGGCFSVLQSMKKWVQFICAATLTKFFLKVVSVFFLFVSHDLFLDICLSSVVPFFATFVCVNTKEWHRAPCCTFISRMLQVHRVPSFPYLSILYLPSIDKNVSFERASWIYRNKRKNSLFSRRAISLASIE